MENDEKITKKVVLIAPESEKNTLNEFLSVLVEVAKDMGILAIIGKK